MRKYPEGGGGSRCCYITQKLTYIRPSDEVVRSLVKGFNDRVFDHIIREVDIESIPEKIHY